MGSLGFFTASMLLALLLALGGLGQVLTPSGSSLLGVLLLFASCAVGAHARNARAAHRHQKKMTGLEQWAQGLGPRERQTRRRP